MRTIRPTTTRRHAIKGLAAAVTAPWVVPALAASTKPIRIALSVAQTGQFGVGDHEDYYKGAKLALKEINSAGGVRGRELKFEVFDINLLSPEGTQATYRAIADAKPQAIGTAFSVIGRPMLEGLGDYHAPLLHGSTQQNIIDIVKANPAKYWHVFEVDPPDTYYGLMFPRFLEELAAGGVWKPINNKVHIIREQSAYNQTIAKAAVKAMKHSKFHLARITDVISPVQDWGPVIEDLKQSGAGVIMCDHWVAAEEAAFCQAFVADPVKGALVYLQYGPSQSEFLSIAGHAAEGMVWSTVLGVYDDQQGAAFRKEFRANYPGTMGLCYTGSAYDTIHFLKEAWMHVDPEDFKGVADYVRTQIYRGVDGAINMNNAYQAAIQYPLQTTDLNKGMATLYFQVQDMRHKIIQPTVLAQSKFQLAPWMTA